MRVPDLRSVFGNGAIAGEFTRRADVQDGLACPRVGVLIQGGDFRVCTPVVGEVGEVEVEIAVSEQRVPDRPKQAGLTGTEVVARDEVEGGARFRLVVIVPPRTV